MSDPEGQTPALRIDLPHHPAKLPAMKQPARWLLAAAVMISAGASLIVGGGGSTPTFANGPAISEPKMSEPAMSEPATQPITVTGFDSFGEPEIRNADGGALEIMFNFMPPLNGSDDYNPHPVFETFEKVLQAELGVDVIRDDRELFIIPKPKPDTAARAKAFLETFWTAYWPKVEKTP